MEAIETTAQFDEEGRLKVDQFPKLKNRKAKVIILLSETENDEWLAFSVNNLSGAYAVDEPEYPLSLIREPNEEYGNG